jgi:acetyl-CoA synthetase
LDKIYPVPEAWAANALVKAADYDRLYAEAANDPDSFWRREAGRLDWMRPFTSVKDTSFDEADFRIRWFADGALNVSANCLDRHLATRGDDIAISGKATIRPKAPGSATAICTKKCAGLPMC